MSGRSFDTRHTFPVYLRTKSSEGEGGLAVRSVAASV